MALLSPNYFAQGMTAFDDQTQRLNQFAQSRATKQAGASIAAGDFQGGSDALNRAGMLDQAHNVLADKQVLDDRKLRDQGLAADQAQKAKAIQIEGLSHLTQAIKQVQPGQRASWLRAQLPNIQALGLPAEQFATLDEEHLTDQALAPWEALLGKAKEDYNIGGVRYSGSSNKPIAGFAEIDPRKTVYAAGEGTDAPSPPASGATPPPPRFSAPLPTNISPQDRDAVARMMVTEASGEGPQGMAAVAHVALNRLAQNYGGAKSLADVINAPGQFEGMSRAGSVHPQDLARANAVLNQVLGGNSPDPTNGAVQYLNPELQTQLGRQQPAWANGSGQRIGHHVFYGGGGSGDSTLQGGVEADTVAPPHLPGFHLVGQAKPEWQDMADGRQRNVITGKVEGTKEIDDKPLGEDAVALVGAQYLRLGPDAMKNMGQGRNGIQNKNRVMEWVAKTAKEAGTSNPELVARFAQNKANLAALNQNTKSLTAVSASEHTLDANLDYAMTFAKRGVGPTGVPILDTPLNKLRIGLGSTDAKDLDNLLTTTTNEYARILTTATGTGGGATSDAARVEAHKLLNAGMTLRQIIDAIKIAKTEAANRRASYVGENARLSSEISGIPQAAPAPPVSSGAGWGKATVVKR
jgi:hypothetical protein